MRRQSCSVWARTDRTAVRGLSLWAIVALLWLSLAAPVLAKHITEFPLPTAGSSPAVITAGPDGALWFTEAEGNKIGRVNTAGVITEFVIPTAGSSPGVITAGPDGALWFTEAEGNKI